MKKNFNKKEDARIEKILKDDFNIKNDFNIREDARIEKILKKISNRE